MLREKIDLSCMEILPAIIPFFMNSRLVFKSASYVPINFVSVGRLVSITMSFFDNSKYPLISRLK
jgi:hypothetical protein